MGGPAPAPRAPRLGHRPRRPGRRGIFAHSLDADAPGSCWVALGIFLEDLWSQGLGEDALDAFLAWAFGDGGRSMVFLRVLEFDARALACYGRAGFRECGRQASDVPREGGRRYADVTMLLRRCDRER